LLFRQSICANDLRKFRHAGSSTFKQMLEDIDKYVHKLYRGRFCAGVSGQSMFNST
jgi:hypothetical protein